MCVRTYTHECIMHTFTCVQTSTHKRTHIYVSTDVYKYMHAMHLHRLYVCVHMLAYARMCSPGWQTYRCSVMTCMCLEHAHVLSCISSEHYKAYLPWTRWQTLLYQFPRAVFTSYVMQVSGCWIHLLWTEKIFSLEVHRASSLCITSPYSIPALNSKEDSHERGRPAPSLPKL